MADPNIFDLDDFSFPVGTGSAPAPTPAPAAGTMKRATRGDWRFWPEREDCTLRVQSGPVGTYTDYALTATGGAVKRRAITFKEMMGSAGVYLNQDRAWLLPEENLYVGVAPKPGDLIVDADGVSWTVGDVAVGKFGNTHKCVSRALQVVNALADTGTLKRPAAGKDAAGRPALASYSTVGTVACRVQPEDSEAAEVFERVVMPTRFTAYLATPLTVRAKDRFEVGEVAYTVLGFKSPQRIWDLMSLSLELVP